MVLLVPTSVLCTPFKQCGLDFDAESFQHVLTNLLFVIGGEDIPAPIRIDLKNCNGETCEVRRSELVKMNLTFRASGNATDVTGSVRVLVRGIWLNVPLGAQKDVCKNLSSGKCPLKVGDEAISTSQLILPAILFPGLKTVAKVMASDQDGKIMFCVEMAFKVIK